MRYDEAESFLFSLPRFALAGASAYSPGLDRIDALLEAMQRPQDSYSSILIAGTNGKGSVASMIAAIATTAGARAGLHTSPHLLFLGERMRVDGVPADRTWLGNSISRYADVIRDIGASFFEASVALSLLYFSEEDVDVAVVEVGMGGRLDATNILSPELSIITNIAFDHTSILGPELTDIAREKAGIMRAGFPVITGTQDPTVNMTLGEIADDLGAEFHLLSAETEFIDDVGGQFFVETLRDRYGPLSISLEGKHQFRNAGLAIRTSELCSRLWTLSRESICAGLESTPSRSGLRARMERIGTHPDIWVDVAHNPQSIAAALETRMSAQNPLSRIFIGLLKDKDLHGIAEVLAASGVPVTILRIDQPRAADPDQLAAVFREHSVRLADTMLGVREALDQWVPSVAPDEVSLVIGSHFIAADALVWARD